MSNLSCSSKTPIYSSKRKSVFLREWWLIEVEGGTKLGVGGFANRETLTMRGMRLLGSASIDKRHNDNTPETGIQKFGSAAIIKRHDINSLETVDGITITISGCINRSHTQHNGFPPEVCNHFHFGFPYNWEDYVAKSSQEKRAESTKRSLPVSFDGLPVTQVRDLLMSASGESEACAFTDIIFSDLLKQLGKDPHNKKVSSVDFNEEVPGNSSKAEVKHNTQEACGLSDATKTKKTHSSLVDLHENLKETEVDHKQEDGDYLSNETQKITKEAQTKSTLIKSCSSKRINDEGNASEKKLKVMKPEGESSVRRSARLKKKA